MKNKKINNSGFTLAELLIVVAIISVLVAIAIPIFTSQLERAREATDAANIRSQYSVVMAEALSSGQSVNGQELCGPVQLKQRIDGWSSETTKNSLESVYGDHIVGAYPAAGGTAWVEFDANGGYPILHYEGGGSGGSEGGGSEGGSGSGGGVPEGSPPFVTEAPIDWDDATASGGSFTVTVGTVYYWNGNYYIGTKNETIHADNVKKDNPDTFTGWYYLAKFTGTIHDMSDYPDNVYNQSPTERGDICLCEGKYYVFKDGGNASYGPIRDKDRWTEIH